VLDRVAPAEFLRVLQQQREPLVVHAKGGFFLTSYRYLTSYKGLAFFTKSTTPLNPPSGCETVAAGGIWIPGL